MYSSKKNIQILGEILKYKKIKHIVCSPGSRNAPLILNFTLQKYFNVYSIVDERCAAFFALGMIQYLKSPVVINCTSGSSVANYYPAVVEAFYQNIPLIIITADRPKEIIDLFDGQTIRQENFFKKHTKKSVNLIEDISEKGLLYNSRLINEAINESFFSKKPIHINIPLSEPLYETTNKVNINPKNIDIIYYNKFFDKKLIYKYKKIWNSHHKKMILIGQININKKLQNLLKKLSEDNSIIILTETLSNICNINFISHIDRIILPIQINDFDIIKPDILLTIGKNIISNKLKILLRSSNIKYHWHIDEIKGEIPDTYHKLTSYCILNPYYFLFFIQKKNNKQSNYKKKWINLDIYRQKKHDLFLEKIEYSDIKVLSNIFKKISKNIIIQLGNSTIVRYYQLLHNKNIFHKSYSNRGTSGIDGSLSTAIGFSALSKYPVTIIIGDISFFYDSNALWNNYIPKNFRIIIINNGGGDIFKYIKKPYISNEIKEKFIENKHNLNAKYICKTFNINYYYADSILVLNKILDFFWKNSKNAQLLEVDTKNCNNDKIFMKYLKYII